MMPFAVGDKVVHPHHGPGWVRDIEHKEFMEGPEHYYVIEIPDQGLILYIPKHRIAETGVRSAMKPAQLKRMLKTLSSGPEPLPGDYKERQEQVWEKLRTGLPLEVAEAVRDLTWYQHDAHLTKKDTDYLDRGRKLLAAEMALVSDIDIAEATKTIEATLMAALAA
jgi:CarD family transcriptional regulator